MDSVCVEDSNNTGQNNTGQNNTGQNNTGQNNTSQNNTGQNNTGQNNTGQNNTGQNNTGQNNTNNTQSNNTHACYVDPFTAEPCEDDGNDVIGRSIPGLETRGCDHTDEFTPGSVTIQSKLCSRESVDKYAPVLIGCRNETFVAEAIFKPAQVCAGEYAVSMWTLGKSCATQNESEDVQCMEMEDGTVIGQFIIRYLNSVDNLNVDIRKDPSSTDVELEYELTVNIR